MGTVGPEATKAGSSPGTSETISVATRAGAASAASRPPLMALISLRMRFITRDRHAGGEQRAGGLLLVLKAHAGARRGQQRGAAARDQRDDQIVGAEAVHLGHHAAGGEEAGLIGHRMGRFDDLDLAGGRAIAVAGDDEATERRAPEALEGGGHLGRGLAGADHDGASARLFRQMRGDGAAGIGSGDGGAKQVFEEVAVHDVLRLVQAAQCRAVAEHASRAHGRRVRRSNRLLAVTTGALVICPTHGPASGSLICRDLFRCPNASPSTTRPLAMRRCGGGPRPGWRSRILSSRRCRPGAMGFTRR